MGSYKTIRLRLANFFRANKTSMASNPAAMASNTRWTMKYCVGFNDGILILAYEINSKYNCEYIVHHPWKINPTQPGFIFTEFFVSFPFPPQPFFEPSDLPLLYHLSTVEMRSERPGETWVFFVENGLHLRSHWWSSSIVPNQCHRNSNYPPGN